MTNPTLEAAARVAEAIPSRDIGDRLFDAHVLVGGRIAAAIRALAPPAAPVTKCDYYLGDCQRCGRRAERDNQNDPCARPRGRFAPLAASMSEEAWSSDPYALASELRRIANSFGPGFRIVQLLRDAADQIDTSAACASSERERRLEAIIKDMLTGQKGARDAARAALGGTDAE